MVKQKKEAVSTKHERPRLSIADEFKDIDVPEPTYRWMNRRREWGIRVKPSKKGITLDSLNVGIYGEVPMTWTDKSRNPRGAIPAKGRPPVGITIKDKTDLWAENAAVLYEEAIQRRWAPATDVPWDSVKQLPEDVEKSICQVCTVLSQYANIDIEIITSWQHQMAYGYHEVKQYLATASFDAARRLEAFRKRALINGGGLGLESPCQVNRLLLESRGGWSEALAGLTLTRGLFTLTMCRYLERHAYNEAERTIYTNVIQDLARLISYGLDHLKFAIAHDEEKRPSIVTTLAIGERMFSRDLRDPVLRESLAIIFGGGIAGAKREGMEGFYRMLDAWVAEYVEACNWLNIDRNVERMPRVFDPSRRNEEASS